MDFTFKTTEELVVPGQIVDQVIGQDHAVEVVKKAAKQRRHVLLIGEPGTGKSMLGVALAGLLPKEKLVDILAFPNPNDENQPLIRVVPASKGREIVTNARFKGIASIKNQNLILFAAMFSVMLGLFLLRRIIESEIIFAASMISGVIILGLIMLALTVGRRMMPERTQAPKVIVDNFGQKISPFWDATGAHAGALLGDVLHDPLQSGGLGTPAHERIVAGMIHKAHLGVLFIDEVATLQPATQQELLTALQEGKYAITGQSERSSGAMVRTEPVPCNFVLVAAGNIDTIQNMHPALRSRIRGYGYEVYMKESMLDTPENELRIARFVAQEVVKDRKIPHFSRDAVATIVNEARKMANRKGHLTLRLRELGGLVRAAGDLALEEGAKLVEPDHIKKAKLVARSLEKQIADTFIERKKEYEVIITKGHEIGRVNGLAVIGGSGVFSGIILPIEAEVTSGGREREIIATGKLGEIAKEAVKNVSAIVKKFFGEDIKEKYDIYVQFLQTYEGVEGDSASVAVAAAIISALKKVPIKQTVALTGSLSVRGEVLPVGGVSAKVEAAINAGIKTAIVPAANMKDIVIDSDTLKKITVIPVHNIREVLEHALVDGKGKDSLLSRFAKA